MKILSYGMGVNSTALAVEAVKRGIRLDLIVTADTGDERVRSYEFLKVFSDWLISKGQFGISVVKWTRKDGSFIPISEHSLRRKELPSKAYGFSGCTSKWKQQPIDKFVREHPEVVAEVAAGRLVERWIGYDADEPERADRMLMKNPQPYRTVKGIQVPVPMWHWRCPLVEWGMGRAECLESIREAGLPSPGKSSCFMCPSMTKKEIDVLAQDEPDLLERALAIEDAARASGELRTVKGLGRTFAWRDYLERKSEALAARETVEEECGCYDGKEP